MLTWASDRGVLAAVDLGEGAGGRWPAIVAVALVLGLILAVVVRHRIRTRRRAELFATVVEGLETLRAAPVAGVDTAPDPDHAEEVHRAGRRIDEALAELDRLSRFETSAAARALRGDASEFAEVLEERLRRESDPYLLDVRITELRERVRWAQDRLDAAVGA